MKLKDVPFENIKVGDRCISAIGTPGVVTFFDPKENGRYKGYIKIQWENGNISDNVIFLCDVPWLGETVEYLGSHE